MKEINVKKIEEKVDYHFKNDNLLNQAFTRKSYAVENNVPSNEILELLGDRVLDLIVIKALLNHFGYIDDNKKYVTTNNITEKDLTEIKAKIVDNENLSKIITDWNFQEYYLLGKGDCEKQVQNELKVKADLFEAIIGAITQDCDFDFNQLQKSVETMLNLDAFIENELYQDQNYIALVQNFYQVRLHCLPEYIIQEITDEDKINNNKHFQARINLSINNNIYEFTAVAKNKRDARIACAKKVYDFIEENHLLLSIKDVCPSLDELTLDNAINTLQELYQKHFIAFPEYTEEDDPKYDENGNAMWLCVCMLEDNHQFGTSGYSTNKKTAKKIAAYSMICHIMGYKNKYSK